MRLVTEMKYLGVIVDDCINFKPLIQQQKQKLRNFKSTLKLAWLCDAPHKIRYIAWKSLLVSRFSYGLSLLANHDSKIRQLQTQILYRMTKSVLQINSNPPT